MTLPQARQTLDAAREGQPVTREQINEALRVTGDLTPSIESYLHAS